MLPCGSDSWEVYVSEEDADLLGKPKIWLYGALFSNNGADYGGYNVAYSTAADDLDVDFCSNCTFGAASEDNEGYANYQGMATPPDSLLFVSPCPGSVYLNNTFSVELALVDGFSSVVSGPVLDDGWEVAMQLDDTCFLSNSSPNAAVDNSTGIADYEAISLLVRPSRDRAPGERETCQQEQI